MAAFHRTDRAGVTWQDVDRVRKENPDWNYEQIATRLQCKSGYVRATFQRRGWIEKLPEVDKIEATFAQIEAAALQSARCPENGMLPGGSASVVALARAGRIRIHIAQKNFRVVELLSGPNAGKRTGGLAGAHVWKIVDSTGTRINGRYVDTGNARRVAPSRPREIIGGASE
jgi:hypothetical protein